MIDIVRADYTKKPVPKNRKISEDLSLSPTSVEEPDFVTPEEVASKDAQIESTTGISGSSKPPKKPWARIADRWKKLSQKQQILVIVIAGTVLIGGTAGALAIFQKDPPPPAPVVIREAPKPVEPPKPTTEASRLTGVQISPELNKLPVTGVMIENSPDARPQSGLKDAGIVFEAIAEGGITRFLALYMEDQPDYIGPVRSVRPYYLDFLVPFDAPIAHAGGSGEALAQIKNEGIKDLDQFANAGAFQRVSNKFAPHNLYTSRAKLLDLHNAKGFTASNFTGWARKEKEAPLETPTVKNIALKISKPLYDVSFGYDAGSNSYLRSLAGQPHKDEKSGEQISPKVVIAIVTDRSNNGIYSVYRVTGSGPVFVFQDGGLVEGTWEKADRKSPYVFKTPDGKPLLLTPGKTWVTLVTGGGVTHSP